MASKDKEFMRVAIAKAKEGIGCGQAPFGACVVKNGSIIASAHNSVWKSTDILAHAEIRAIRQACEKSGSVDLSGCVIYSTCEPCPMCFCACHWARISKIVYGARIKDAQKLGFSELAISNASMKRMGGSCLELKSDFLKNECLELFRMWKELGAGRVY